MRFMAFPLERHSQYRELPQQWIIARARYESNTRIDEMVMYYTSPTNGAGHTRCGCRGIAATAHGRTWPGREVPVRPTKLS
jgi:hypothetical protein